MARFKNTFTGVTVSVDEEKADRFTTNGWERADEKKPVAEKNPAKKTSK